MLLQQISKSNTTSTLQIKNDGIYDGGKLLVLYFQMSEKSLVNCYLALRKCCV